MFFVENESNFNFEGKAAINQQGGKIPRKRNSFFLEEWRGGYHCFIVDSDDEEVFAWRN